MVTPPASPAGFSVLGFVRPTAELELYPDDDGALTEVGPRINWLLFLGRDRLAMGVLVASACEIELSCIEFAEITAIHGHLVAPASG